MDPYELEAATGLRVTWRNLPHNRLLANKCVIPFGIHYSPLQQISDLATVTYNPLKCKCGAAIHPYTVIDYRRKAWICSFCQTVNQFPKTYADNISESNLPQELQPEALTIEYVRELTQPGCPLFVFIIDLCLPAQELYQIRDSIQQALSQLPEDIYICLITFNRNVFIHEIGHSAQPKCYAFSGLKQYNREHLLTMLGISVSSGKTATVNLAQRFIMKLKDCEFTLLTILDNIQPDTWPSKKGKRSQRATGSAINMAVSLLEYSQIQGARLILFVGGSCTIGPGSIVSLDLTENIRSYLDMQQENSLCKMVKPARKFYDSIAARCVALQSTIDVFGFSPEQFGLYEMQGLADRTGGYVHMHETFCLDIFTEAFKKIFQQEEGELKIAMEATTELFVSKQLKVQGAIGSCSSLGKSNSSTSGVSLGQGGTMQWFMGGINNCSTICFVLDINVEPKEDVSGQFAFFQIQTTYRTYHGMQKFRVTTLRLPFVKNDEDPNLLRGFDAEAAGSLMARIGIVRAEEDSPLELTKWLDRSLIRLLVKFAQLQGQNIEFRLMAPQLKFYSDLMYHLRRSHFIQTFGASPDEVAFYRSQLMRESVTSAMLMIQPSLMQYTMEDPAPNPVKLDVESYFMIRWSYQIMEGSKLFGKIFSLMKDQSEYADFKTFLEQPNQEIPTLLNDRQIIPSFFETYPGHTKERYLKSRVNPSRLSQEMIEAGTYITDEANLQRFREHLINLVTQQRNQG